MGTRPQVITEMLRQKKINSWTPVGPTRARASGTNRLTLKSLRRSRRRATKEGSMVIIKTKQTPLILENHQSKEFSYQGP